MDNRGYLNELRNCRLCEWKCGVNRLAGERGVCRMTTPPGVVASAQLHPAPPESYTVFFAGCNFKCLNCQNWTISTYPDHSARMRGFLEPEKLARECVRALRSPAGGMRYPSARLRRLSPEPGVQAEESYTRGCHLRGENRSWR